MINNFNKIIHNKYSKYIKFIFYLRYLFTIFFISLVIFLLGPHFINYDQKVAIINDYTGKNYNFEIYNYEKISFKSLPIPNFEIKNSIIKLDKTDKKFKVKKLKIYPNFFSIYNFKNFHINKLVLQNSKFVLEAESLKILSKLFFVKHNKLFLDDFNLEIEEEKKSILKLKKIRFFNYGTKKDLITGKVFDQKFEILIHENLNSLKFKLLDTGIETEITFDKKNKDDLVSGILKAKILNTNLKFNFNHDYKTLDIINLYFRSKNLSFKNESKVIIKPFLDIYSIYEIEDFNLEILNNFDIKLLQNKKNLLKKLNSKNEINFIFNKLNRNLIDKLDLKMDFAYGRINFSKKLTISDNYFMCEGFTNLFEENPLLVFDCSIISQNKQSLLKKFSVKLKDKEKKMKLYVSGNVNILSKKINFKNISMDKGYIATNEDLKYFKETFENRFFDKDIYNALSKKNIRKFILDIL